MGSSQARPLRIEYENAFYRGVGKQRNHETLDQKKVMELELFSILRLDPDAS